LTQVIQTPVSTTTNENENDENNNAEEKQLTRLLPTVVSSKYDWDRIAACLDSKHFGCVYYGLSAAERLLIPKETCRLASKHGWTQTKKKQHTHQL